MTNYVKPEILRAYTVRGLLNRMRYCQRLADQQRGESMNLYWLHWFGEYGNALDELRRRRQENPTKEIMVAWEMLGID